MAEITCKPGDGFFVRVLPVKADGVTPARVENPRWSSTGAGITLTPDAGDWHQAAVNCDANVIGTLAAVVTFTCDADLDETEVRELSASTVFIVKEEEAESIAMSVERV